VVSLPIITMLYCSLMERIWFYEYALVFTSNVLVTKFPQRCNCEFRSSGCDTASVVRFTFQNQGSAFVRKVGNQSVSRSVTSPETAIQSVESSLPEMLQSYTNCGATQQPHCTGFEPCNRTVH